MANDWLFDQGSLKRHGEYFYAIYTGKEALIQIMAPESIWRRIAVVWANRSEQIRNVVLRGLQTIGIDVPEPELADRRGRRRNNKWDGNGAE